MNTIEENMKNEHSCLKHHVDVISQSENSFLSKLG